MARLIDANSLRNAFRKRMIERFDKDLCANEENCKTCYPGCSWIHIIEREPAVDAVEVVRCKDCKHYDNSEGIFWCKLNSKFYPGGMDWHSFPEDGYCSYGERKDNGL